MIFPAERLTLPCGKHKQKSNTMIGIGTPLITVPLAAKIIDGAEIPAAKVPRLMHQADKSNENKANKRLDCDCLAFKNINRPRDKLIMPVPTSNTAER